MQEQRGLTEMLKEAGPNFHHHSHDVSARAEKPAQNEETFHHSTNGEAHDNGSRKEMNEYFRGMLRKKGNKTAQEISEQAENLICLQIMAGEVSLPQQQSSLDKILFESRIKEEAKKNAEEEQSRKRALIQMQLKYLDRQLSAGKKSRDSEDNEFAELSHGNHVFSKKQHEQFLTKIAKQKSQLSLKKKSLEKQQKQKQEEEQKIKKASEQDREQKEKEERKKKIMEKLEEQKKEHEKKVKDEEENNRRLSELKLKKFLHQKLEEKYNTEIVLPSLEQKKKKLKEIRQMSKAFNVDDINNHQKQYLKKKEQQLSSSQTKKSNEQWHYKMPEKSQKLAKLLQEESMQAKLKLEQKKRKLEEKIQRQQEFVSYLKQKYPPTIDPKKRQQIQQRLRLKSETKEGEKPDGKTLGMNYLEEVKKQRKKSANSQMQFERKQVLLQESEAVNKKSQTNYLKTRRTKQEYQEMRQKRIDRLINSDATDRSQKIMKLQMEATKLIEEQKRNEEKQRIMKNKKNIDQDDTESTNLLLTSIKAKMGIIDLYNKQ